MDTNKQTDQAAQAIPEAENPLLFWTAYILTGDGKRKYLGNGKGGYRLFKTLDGTTGLNAYLDKYVHPARRAEVHVQSVQGKINAPVDDATLNELQPQSSLPHLPKILDRLPIKAPLPIATFARETLPPTAIEQLHEYEARSKKKRKRK